MEETKSRFKRICVLCGSSTGKKASYQEAAVELGKELEFWVGNEELVHMYQQGLGDAGYVTFQLGRTNNRGDGLLTAVHKDYFEVLNYQDLLFNDIGDRVAQLLFSGRRLPW